MDQHLKYTVKGWKIPDAIDGMLLTADRNKVLELIQVSPENQSRVNLQKLARNPRRGKIFGFAKKISLTCAGIFTGYLAKINNI